jgi:trans-aconitate 3-methyltransferase
MSWFFKEVTHSKLYLQHRPAYSGEVFKTILSWLSGGNSNSRWRTAIDVGCGTGQSTLPLCDHFDEVIGIDSSETQLEEARQHAVERNKLNVKYISGVAHDISSIVNDTVDLVTAAQAAHWFDLEKFLKESLRVLKPGGALAVYGHGLPIVTKAEGHHILMEVSAIKFHTYLSNVLVSCNWLRKFVMN